VVSTHIKRRLLKPVIPGMFIPDMKGEDPRGQRKGIHPSFSFAGFFLVGFLFLPHLFTGDPPVNGLLFKTPYPTDPFRRDGTLFRIFEDADLMHLEIFGGFLGGHDLGQSEVLL